MELGTRKIKLAVGEKKVGAFIARRNFGRVLKDITTNKERYYIESNGNPVAVIVPLNIYEQWKKSKESFLKNLTKSQKAANLTPEKADNLALEAVKYAKSVKKESESSN